MGLLWENKAWEEYCSYLSEDKKTIKRINELIKNIQRDPFNGIGKPEPLKGNYSGWWSRRIDDHNRIVYKKSGNDIIIVSVKGHYE